MCGISGIFGLDTGAAGRIGAMLRAQQHRGPDNRGVYISPAGRAALAHNRLSIIDLSEAGHQPMCNAGGTLWIAFNGEIYNYVELRRELEGYPWRSRTDTEVVLAAFERWGEACLDRFIGMFALLIWDERNQRLFAARDRFGVKPLYYHQSGAGLVAASEIKALHAAGVARTPNAAAWAAYLGSGVHDSTGATFWDGIRALPAGCVLKWHDGVTAVSRWYDLAAHSGADYDSRPATAVRREYRALIEDSVRLRFRADVPAGVNLSGGLDSSILLGVVQAVQGRDSDVRSFTFATGDERYDELPWVNRMLAATLRPSTVCLLRPEEVPALAASVQRFQDEPFGGLPTLAYARLFERARQEGVIVLLDGQGMDEQWAGYDYYARLNGRPAPVVQGSAGSPLRPECLTPDFAAAAEPFIPAERFNDWLRNTQLRDLTQTKIPRALRFHDRVSMRASTELREPFLDHRLVELALRQRPELKISNGKRKWLLRQIAAELLPGGVAEGPKRPLQTPQREWLRGPLRGWATDCIEAGLRTWGRDWLDAAAVRREWRAFAEGAGDNSFFVWQWINLGLAAAPTC